jgi:Tannase and feruloyl esterase
VNKLLLIAALTLGTLQVTTSAHADTVPPDAAKARCHSLVNEDFSGTIDAPAYVTNTKFVAASGNVPVYCEVHGYVAPTVGFLLRLPATNWNGKFFERGCGGFCGDEIMHDDTPEGRNFIGPVSRGYAYLTFDGGHQVGFDDAIWGWNNLQAQFDFGVRAPHVAALAGKAVTERFYGKVPARSYFSGCSSGGQEALSEAQRFPWDFDGIIAGAPSPTFSGPMMYYLWSGRTLSGVVHQVDLKLLHDKVVAKCDMDDGVKDGVIGDPLHCNYDPAELSCKGGYRAGECLTAPQIEAVKKVYAGPTTSRGEKIYTGGPLPGSEMNWMNDSAREEVVGEEHCCAYVDDSGAISRYPQMYFAYIGFMPAPGPSWKSTDFDFDRDYKRLRLVESLFGAADNPDLRKFKAAGGKLIMYQGGQDHSDIPTDAIDYYDTVERLMGGRSKTQDFFRLFVIPGMNHCTTGPGAFAIDYDSSLEAWVERRQAPDKMIGAHVNGTDLAESFTLTFPLDPKLSVSFTRPVFPYPLRAKYKGSGDTNDAETFVPIGSTH